MSVNTNLNSTVYFTCEATGVDFIYFLANGTSAEDTDIEDRGFSPTPQTTFNGTTRTLISVWAQAINNNTNISCVGEPGTFYSRNATLMIQGKLINYLFFT